MSRREESREEFLARVPAKPPAPTPVFPAKRESVPYDGEHQRDDEPLSPVDIDPLPTVSGEQSVRRLEEEAGELADTEPAGADFDDEYADIDPGDAALINARVDAGSSLFEQLAFRPESSEETPTEDETPEPEPEPGATSSRDTEAGDAATRRGLSRPALLFMGAIAVIIVGVVGGAVAMSGPEPKRAAVAERHYTPSTPAAASTVTATGGPTAPGDHELPYTATGYCGPGSTPAQKMSESTGGPWLCTRGGTDGQVAKLVFDRAYRISAVSLVPGAVPKTPGGADTWMTARVPKRIQITFNDQRRSFVTMDTQLAHGEVSVAVPGVIASAATILILETDRPPRVAAPSTTPSGQAGGDPFNGGLLTGDDGFPPLAQTSTAPAPDAASAGDQKSDPIDAQFAISSLKMLGREPY